MTKKRKKELSRIRKFISRAEKRGYTFTDEFKASITEKTTRALQYLTPKKLYENATYYIDSHPVTGLRGRQIERERAARKGIETRQRKKEPAPLPKITNIVYQNVMDIINTYPSSPAAEYLDNLLKSEINKWGLDLVMLSMESMDDDVIKKASEIIWYQGDSMKIHESLKNFADAINSGVIQTKEELKRQNDVLEKV